MQLGRSLVWDGEKETFVNDPEAKFIGDITLSYTFFETPLPEEQAAITPASKAEFN